MELQDHTQCQNRQQRSNCFTSKI